MRLPMAFRSTIALFACGVPCSRSIAAAAFVRLPSPFSSRSCSSPLGRGSRRCFSVALGDPSFHHHNRTTGAVPVMEPVTGAPSSSSLSSVLPPLPEGSRRVYLLRHGETHWNALGKIQGGGHDIELNENGRKQAAAVAEALAGLPITVVASSPLKRAHATADAVWETHRAAVGEDRRVVLPGLAEMSFGEFEGVSWRESDCAQRDEFKAASRRTKEDPDYCFPGGGESTRAVAERSTEALSRLLADHPSHEHLAVVAHGRTNKVLIAATGLSDPMQFPTVEQGNTCINVMDVDQDGNWTIRILNYLEHVKDFVIIR